MFWPLPPPTAKAGDHRQLPTHVISDGSGAHFAIGRFDPETERFVPSGGGGGGNRTFNLDLGSFAFSAAGQADDGRLLLTGWVPAGHAAPVPSGCPKIGGISICGYQTLSAIREMCVDASTASLTPPPSQSPFMACDARRHGLW